MERHGAPILLGAVMLGYAVVALGRMHWWISGLSAPVVAVLLWRRHPRARFSAYILLSLIALRGVFGPSWAALAFAAGVLALLQTPAALRAWPRLRPGVKPRWRARGGGDRMAGP